MPVEAVIPFAVGNFLEALLLGRSFDGWSRRKMIALTYGVSGLLLAGTGALFARGVLGRRRRPRMRGLLLRIRDGELGVPDGERAISRARDAS